MYSFGLDILAREQILTYAAWLGTHHLLRFVANCMRHYRVAC